MSGVPSYMPKAKVYCEFSKQLGYILQQDAKDMFLPSIFFLWKYKYKKNKPVSIRTYSMSVITCALNVYTHGMKQLFMYDEVKGSMKCFKRNRA